MLKAFSYFIFLMFVGACGNHGISILSGKNETAEFNIVDSMYYLSSYEVIHDDKIIEQLQSKYGYINYHKSSETERLSHIKQVAKSIQKSFTYASDNGAPLMSWTNGIKGLLSDDASFLGDCEDLTLTVLEVLIATGIPQSRFV